jgi:SAM-dependent methyltransferase
MTAPEQNRRFYNDAYRARGVAVASIKALLSYDQLSKARRNLEMARSVPGFGVGLSILDFGFGHGTFLLRLPRCHRLLGAELSDVAVSNLRGVCKLIRRDVSVIDIDKVDSSTSQHVDLVCCSHVIEHVDDDDALVTLFHRLLVPRGHLLLNVPINEVWTDPNHVRAYDQQSTRDLLDRNCFDVIETTTADRWTAWLLHHEQKGSKLLLRLVRLALAVTPASAADAFERLLAQRYLDQQLVVLARKR